jgi:hypothetical protein
MSNYAVYRVFRDWEKRPEVLMDGLTREQAQTIVKNTPSDDRSMVVFDEEPKDMTGNNENGHHPRS